MTLNGCGCQFHGGHEAREAWLITNRIGMVRADHWAEIDDLAFRVIAADPEYPIGQLVEDGFGVEALRILSGADATAAWLAPEAPGATERPFYHRYRTI